MPVFLLGGGGGGGHGGTDLTPLKMTCPFTVFFLLKLASHVQPLVFSCCPPRFLVCAVRPPLVKFSEINPECCCVPGCDKTSECSCVFASFDG